MRLILFPNQSDNFFIDCLKSENIKGTRIEYTYKPISKFKRILRKIHLKLLNYKQEIWYGDLKDIKKVETVIIFDSILNFHIIDFLKRENPEIKIIFWFWNTIRDEKKIKVLKTKNIEIWSFDLNDCKKYNLKRNTQFFFENNLELFIPQNQNEIIYFIGVDKGRISKIKEILENIKKIEKKVELKIQILKDKKRKYSPSEDIELLEHPIPYSEIIDQIKKSTILLEICQYNQSGLTLRTLEALMFNKKLITNNQEVINYDFYKKENIYVIGEKRKLDEFLNEKICIVENKIKEKYLFKNWIENFFKKDILE